MSDIKSVQDADPSPVSVPPPERTPRASDGPRVWELASGIDALYLSGQASISEWAAARSAAAGA